jgi:diadenosine tetraphosphate (Ap4A) HIT family hydrolase
MVLPVNWRNDRLAAIHDGKNPTLITEMEYGYAVMADMQFLPGWCILLPKRYTESLNSLSLGERQGFLLDMCILGDAIIDVCHPVRVNYDILGNSDTYLHAHVYLRYSWESPERASSPSWLYPDEYWQSKGYSFSLEKSLSLLNKLRAYLQNVNRSN